MNSTLGYFVLLEMFHLGIVADSDAFADDIADDMADDIADAIADAVADAYICWYLGWYQSWCKYVDNEYVFETDGTLHGG